MNNRIISGTTILQGEEVPTRQKKNGIKGSSSKKDIQKRHTIIQQILSNQDLSEYTKEEFIKEFVLQCKSNGLKLPSKETIRTDLLTCGYELKKGMFLKKSKYNPASLELLEQLLYHSSIYRLTAQVKNDEYIILPFMVSNAGAHLDTLQYCENIYSSIENDYNNIITTHINLYFRTTGYESAIASLLYNLIPDTILCFTINTYGITISSTVEYTSTILKLIYNALPIDFELLEIDNPKQPF